MPKERVNLVDRYNYLLDTLNVDPARLSFFNVIESLPPRYKANPFLISLLKYVFIHKPPGIYRDIYVEGSNYWDLRSTRGDSFASLNEFLSVLCYRIMPSSFLNFEMPFLMNIDLHYSFLASKYDLALQLSLKRYHINVTSYGKWAPMYKGIGIVFNSYYAGREYLTRMINGCLFSSLFSSLEEYLSQVGNLAYVASNFKVIMKFPKHDKLPLSDYGVNYSNFTKYFGASVSLCRDWSTNGYINSISISAGWVCFDTGDLFKVDIDFVDNIISITQRPGFICKVVKICKSECINYYFDDYYNLNNGMRKISLTVNEDKDFVSDTYILGSILVEGLRIFFNWLGQYVSAYTFNVYDYFFSQHHIMEPNNIFHYDTISSLTLRLMRKSLRQFFQDVQSIPLYTVSKYLDDDNYPGCMLIHNNNLLGYYSFRTGSYLFSILHANGIKFLDSNYALYGYSIPQGYDMDIHPDYEINVDLSKLLLQGRSFLCTKDSPLHAANTEGFCYFESSKLHWNEDNYLEKYNTLINMTTCGNCNKFISDSEYYVSFRGHGSIDYSFGLLKVSTPVTYYDCKYYSNEYLDPDFFCYCGKRSQSGLTGIFESMNSAKCVRFNEMHEREPCSYAFSDYDDEFSNIYDYMSGDLYPDCDMKKISYEIMHDPLFEIDFTYSFIHPLVVLVKMELKSLLIDRSFEGKLIFENNSVCLNYKLLRSLCFRLCDSLLYGCTDMYYSSETIFETLDQEPFSNKFIVDTSVLGFPNLQRSTAYETSRSLRFSNYHRDAFSRGSKEFSELMIDAEKRYTRRKLITKMLITKSVVNFTSDNTWGKVDIYDEFGITKTDYMRKHSESFKKKLHADKGHGYINEEGIAGWNILYHEYYTSSSVILV
jgi:hypothetical protein